MVAMVCVCVCRMASHKPLLLYVWCGGLTVAMLVMAALLISIKSQSSQVSESMKRHRRRLDCVRLAPSASGWGKFKRKPEV